MTTPVQISKASLIRLAAVLALAIVTLYIYFPKYSPSSTIAFQGYEPFALAESILNHHSFADPFWAAPTGPSAHLPPLYPALLALLLKVFGHTSAAIGVLAWTTNLLFAIQLMMLPFLSRRFGLGYWTGVLASVAWLSAGIGPSYLWEGTLTSLILIAVAFPMQASLQGQMSRRQVVTAFILWAFLLLLQPVCIVVLLAWFLLLHFKFKTPTRSKDRACRHSHHRIFALDDPKCAGLPSTGLHPR